MRPLTEDETKTLFTKLSTFLGPNLVHMVDAGSDNDDPHVFRLHRSRVFWVRESIMRAAISVPRASLISLGTCLGKFSKTGKFRIHITALDVLAQFAKYRCWAKPNAESSWMYGNHLVKAHLHKITEDTPEHQAVVVMGANDVPIGFGVTARSTLDTKKLDPTAILVFNQADIGEYLRDEDTLF